MSRAKRRRRRVPPYPTNPVNWYELHLGGDYSDEESEFLRAIDEYKRLYQRPFPTWREVLHVFKSLGWRKQRDGVTR
ncbi:MAG TPA: hypothetical protein VKI65_05385 [Gemmataceae bacterium]|nr:hypothetical protein [Gemmataceae bacterium]